MIERRVFGAIVMHFALLDGDFDEPRPADPPIPGQITVDEALVEAAEPVQEDRYRDEPR